jgi:hypothetical protein
MRIDNRVARAIDDATCFSIKRRISRVALLLLHALGRRGNNMFYRRPMITMMLMCCAVCAQAASPGEATSAVTIRIHDYAGTDTEQLQRAEEQVSDTYASIGVRLDWRTIVRPAAVEAGKASWPPDVTAITIVVLAADMARRLHLPLDVAGYAPITREHGGRVAFVMGARTRDIAEGGNAPHAQVLAGVISHELAHLLMPERSHSSAGVMRARWRPWEFRDVDRQRFSASEASAIRQMVRTMGGNQSRVAD